MPPDAATAAAHYRLASAGFGNTPAVPSFLFAPIQAKLALGYLHEFGAGVPQDLNLAKRHYESALETAGPAWLPPRVAVNALRVHRAWRRTAAAYPILHRLQQPLDAAVRWALHRCRRLIDPVYAFHVPTLPPSNFVPGETGLDSFAEAPPPSQPLGVTAAEPTAPAEAPQPAARRVPRRRALPGAVTAAWERVRAEVTGAIGNVQRFVRTMLMLDGGFAPSTAVIVGLLVLRIVLQFVMEALMAQGRGAAAAGDGGGDEGRDDAADGGDLGDGNGVAGATQEPNFDVADQLALASPASVSESDFSPSPAPAAAEDLSEGPGAVVTASTVTRGGMEGGVREGSATVSPRSVGLQGGGPGEAAPSSVRYEDAMERAVEEARRRSVAAAMSRMHAQGGRPEGSNGGGVTDAVEMGTRTASTSSPAVSAAHSPAEDGSLHGVRGAAAPDQQAGAGRGDDTALPDRVRGAGWMHELEEDMGDDEDAASADQGGDGDAGGSAPSGAAGTSLSSGQDQDSGWAGFGTVASDTDGPPAGFWAASSTVGSMHTAVSTGYSRSEGVTAFSQLSCALGGSAGGAGGFAEPSPLSHSMDLPDGQERATPVAGPPPPLAFPALDLLPAASQAPGPSDVPAGPPQLALDLPPLQTGTAAAAAGAHGLERGFGSPVSDATAHGGSFSGFPLLGVPAGLNIDTSVQHDAASLGVGLPQQWHPPHQDDDDLPDLDPSGQHTLPSITLTGHTLPVSTAAAFGVPASGSPLLLEPHGAGSGPDPNTASPVRKGAVEVEELKAGASSATAAAAAGGPDAVAGGSI